MRSWRYIFTGNFLYAGNGFENHGKFRGEMIQLRFAHINSRKSSKIFNIGSRYFRHVGHLIRKLFTFEFGHLL